MSETATGAGFLVRFEPVVPVAQNQPLRLAGSASINGWANCLPSTGAGVPGVPTPSQGGVTVQEVASGTDGRSTRRTSGTVLSGDAAEVL